MQTIVTKFLGPTNTLGARIKATSSGGISATIPFPYELSGVPRDALAVQALNKKLKWQGEMVVGGLKDGGYIFVFANDEKMTLETEEETK
ncbi:MAG: hypothetical protein KAG66_03115 [Methylococcales bacterium]|nr:hypothetical protein [Methylococcales bacterium]